jgi:hypothetical protein
MYNHRPKFKASQVKQLNNKAHRGVKAMHETNPTIPYVGLLLNCIGNWWNNDKKANNIANGIMKNA